MNNFKKTLSEMFDPEYTAHRDALKRVREKLGLHDGETVHIPLVKKTSADDHPIGFAPNSDVYRAKEIEITPSDIKYTGRDYRGYSLQAHQWEPHLDLDAMRGHVETKRAEHAEKVNKHPKEHGVTQHDMEKSAFYGQYKGDSAAFTRGT